MKRLVFCIAIAIATTSATLSAPARAEESVEADEPLTEAEIDESLDEVMVDVQGSVADADDRRGLLVAGDLRSGFLFSGEDFSDFDPEDSNFIRARWRLGAALRFAEGFRVIGRVAGLCSTERCRPDPVLQPHLPGSTSLDDGQITVDELLLHWYGSEQLSVAVGRMETKFVTRGGVYAKSLERNDSNNLRVNWTDGLHALYRTPSGWNTHLILQYNSEDGPGTVRRPPLDFASSRSRVSYHLALENLEPRRRMIQRALSLSYLPAALRREQGSAIEREDYLGLVARLAHRWPQRDEGWRIRSSLEAGYAFETPSLSEVGLVGEGAADGLAWATTVSLMDFVPKHSIGVNYARTEAGWLLSPQYSSNEELVELRYVWRPAPRLTVDVRGRWRDPLREVELAGANGDRYDFYARATWSFDVLERGAWSF